MGKVKSFLNSKIVKKDVGEPTYLTWKEALSYAMGRGAQGMSTSMTASKYNESVEVKDKKLGQKKNTVDVTNTYNNVPTTGIIMNTLPYVMMIIAVFLMRLTTR